MINSSQIKKVLFTTICALLIFPAAAYSIQVSYYMGDVTVLRCNKAVKGLNMGTKLEIGDVVQTGKNGTITISYDDGSQITLSPNSKAKIGSKKINSDNVALLSGNLKGKFSKLKKGKRKVYTPTIVCAIRGTEFKIGVSDGGDSRVDLSEGKLDINNPYGKTKLNPNQNVQASIGDSPEKTKGSLDKWQSEQNQAFQKRPGKKGKEYNKYMDTFNSRSKKQNKDMEGYDKMVKKADSKSKLNRAGKKLTEAEETIEDDFMLNDTANGSMDNIINSMDQKEKGYSQFKKAKNKSDMVQSMQEKNYQAIMEIREAYNKAYEEIMGKYKKDRDKILGDFDLNSVQPKLD